MHNSAYCSTLTLGELLKRFRIECGLSQRELAEGICFRTYISEIEQGDRYPAAQLLAQLAERLQVSLERFVDAYLASPMCGIVQSLALARQLAEEGLPTRAQDVLERCHQLLQLEPKPQTYDPDIYETQGIIFYQQQRLAEATQQFQRAVQIRRKTKSRKFQLARSLFRLGLCALQAGITVLAEEVLLEAYHTILWLDPAEAQEKDERVISLHERVVQALGYLMLSTRNLHGALHVYRFASARWQTYGILAEPTPDIPLGQAIAEMGTGNFAEARRILLHLQRVHKSPAILVRVHNNLGVLDRLAGNGAEATHNQHLAWQVYQQAGEGDPRPICNELIRCCLLRDDLAEAETWLDRAMALPPAPGDSPGLAETFLLGAKLALAKQAFDTAHVYLIRASEQIDQTSVLSHQIRIERARLGLATSDYQSTTAMLASLERDLGWSSI